MLRFNSKITYFTQRKASQENAFKGAKSITYFSQNYIGSNNSFTLIKIFFKNQNEFKTKTNKQTNKKQILKMAKLTVHSAWHMKKNPVVMIELNNSL